MLRQLACRLFYRQLLAIVLTSLVTSAAWFWASRTPSHVCSVHSGLSPHLLSPQFGGVRRYAIPGAFPRDHASEGNGTVAGVLQIFLKAGIWDGRYHIRGFVIFEFNELPPHFKSNVFQIRLGMFNVPEVFHFMRLSVRSNGEGWQKDVPLNMPVCDGFWNSPGPHPSRSFLQCIRDITNPDNHMPRYPLTQIDFDMGPLHSTDVDLLVEGWPRIVSLAELLQGAVPMPQHHVPALPFSRPTIINHIACLYKVDVPFVAQMLTWRAEHLAEVGVETTFLYVKSRYAPALASNSVIQSLIARNQLRLVVWEELSMWTGEAVYEKVVEVAHAVLSFWGSPTQVLVTDVDEFIVSKGKLASVLSSAPSCVSSVVGCATFHRYNVLPPAGKGDELSPAAWSTPGPSPLNTFYQQALVAVTSMGNLHSFHNPKSIMDPNAAYVPPSLHTTVACGSRSPEQCTDYLPCPEVSRDCAWIAHFPSMFAYREEPPNTTLHALSSGWLQMEQQQPQFWLQAS